MGKAITGSVRGVAPCKGCQRPEKKSGCHDRCKDFRAWRETVDAINKKRSEYANQPFSKIL